MTAPADVRVDDATPWTPALSVDAESELREAVGSALALVGDLYRGQGDAALAQAAKLMVAAVMAVTEGLTVGQVVRRDEVLRRLRGSIRFRDRGYVVSGDTARKYAADHPLAGWLTQRGEQLQVRWLTATPEQVGLLGYQTAAGGQAAHWERWVRIDEAQDAIDAYLAERAAAIAGEQHAASAPHILARRLHMPVRLQDGKHGCYRADEHAHDTAQGASACMALDRAAMEARWVTHGPAGSF